MDTTDRHWGNEQQGIGLERMVYIMFFKLPEGANERVKQVL
jgi:hypothetical protein